jgi:hypothetical protein
MPNLVPKHCWEMSTELTPWNWALLEKPPVAQLLKNFPTFYGTRRFIPMFTRALHCLSWARSIQSILSPSYFSEINLKTILPPMSRSSYWSFFLSGFPTKPICILLLPNACYIPCLSHPPWLDHSNYILLYLAKSKSYEAKIIVLCVFREQMRRQIVLNCVVACIFWISSALILLLTAIWPVPFQRCDSSLYYHHNIN